MDRMLYIAMSGAKEATLAQQVNTQNLANISTTGFRGDLESMLSEPVYGPGFPDRAYALSNDLKSMDYTPGGLETTGRDLDVAVKGEGWVVIQAPDGTQALTRRGDLDVTATGMLVTADNNPVMGEGGPIVLPPSEKILIGLDGTISVRPQGQQANATVVVDRIMLVNPDKATLEKGNDGLVRYNGDQQLVPDAGVQIVSGVLEKSNVNGVQAMVRMIELQRYFETQVKMMDQAKSNAEKTTSLMRMG